MPSDYHLQSFWEQRFRTESHFEWLGDGQDTLIPRLRTCLHAASAPTEDRLASGICDVCPPRTLHIGAGNSALSERVRDVYDEAYGRAAWDGSNIVNLDFSDTAVQNGQQTEISKTQSEGDGRQGVRWVQADVLRWEDLSPLVNWKDRSGGNVDREFARKGDGDLFAVVLDKSTSDAIACGEDIVLTASSPRCHPAVRKGIATSGNTEAKIDPLRLLALNLAPIVRVGGAWLILSYSSSRVSFLDNHRYEDGRDKDIGAMDARLYWSLEEHETVDAPSGQRKEGVYAPAVQNHVYVLRRSSNLLE